MLNGNISPVLIARAGFDESHLWLQDALPDFLLSSTHKQEPEMDQ